MESYNNYLMHYGRLGQKWGVRNGPPYPLGKRIKRKISNSNPKTMSDEALRSEVNRLRLEKEYRELSKSSMTNGLKFATSLLVTSGTVALSLFTTNVASGIAVNLAKNLVLSKINK